MKLKFKNVCKNYGNQVVLNNLTGVVSNAKAIVIIGPSGGGKSTLLRILAGLEDPDSGKITLNNHILPKSHKDIREYRKQMAVVFQAFNLFPHLSAIDNIALPLEKVHNFSKSESINRGYKLLEQFKIEEHKDKKPNQLSGGQKQRVAIARAFALNPEVMFLDEPTSALDPDLTYEVLDAIKELKRNNKQLILVTHEMKFAREIGDYGMFIKDGIIFESGEANVFFNNPKSESLKRFLDRGMW